MAIGTVNGGGNDWLIGTNIITGLPVTFAMFIYPTNDDATLNRLCGIALNASDGITLTLNTNGAGDPLAFIIQNSGGIMQGDTTTGVTFNDVWYHACATFWETAGPTTNGEIFIDGGSEVTNSLGGTHGTWNLIKIFKQGAGGGAEYTGYGAELGVWNVRLTNPEIATLAAGYCPLLVRRESLIHYVPMFDKASPSIDIMQQATWTWNGSPTVQNHPPGIIYPKRTIYGMPALVAAAEPVFLPIRR